MAKAAAKPKKPTTRQAYKNAQQLREVIRGIYRACELDSAHSGYSSPEQAAKRLAGARTLTDNYLAGLSAFNRKQLEGALNAERIASAQVGQTGHLNVMVQQAYELVQVLPSWDGLPEGLSENKLRAVEALLKTSKAETAPALVLNAISLIVGVKKPEPVPKPKPKAQVTVSMGPEPPILEETGKPKSPHHQEPVDKEQGEGYVWGYHAPYYMIKKGTPMTWGAHLVWVDKGHKKPGKPGDKYYVHPGYATLAIKDHHHLVMADDKLGGSEDDGDDEAVF